MIEPMRSFRKARIEDLPRILELIECGRQKMRAAGNNEQWTNGQPSQEVIEEDIRLGESYVMTENGIVVVTSGGHLCFQAWTRCDLCKDIRREMAR